MHGEMLLLPEAMGYLLFENPSTGREIASLGVNKAPGDF